MASMLCQNNNKIYQKLLLNPCQTCLQTKKWKNIRILEREKTHESLGTIVDFESFARSMGDPEMYEKTMKIIPTRFNFRSDFIKKEDAWESHGKNDGNRAQMACKKEAKTKTIVMIWRKTEKKCQLEMDCNKMI